MAPEQPPQVILMLYLYSCDSAIVDMVCMMSGGEGEYCDFVCLLLCKEVLGLASRGCLLSVDEVGWL